MRYIEQEHHSHPHKLELVYHRIPYRCDGCKEIGFGLSYTCEPCNFDLHKDCILATSSTSHPFYPKCNFNFLDHAPGIRSRYCDACGKDVKGFVYHCTKTGRDLHPCCSNLPYEIEGEGVKLTLHEKLSSKCSWCGKRRLWKGVTGWSYVSTCDTFHFHVSCVKEMLVKKWENGHFRKGAAGGTRVEQFDDDENTSLALERNVIQNMQLATVNQADNRIQDGVRKYWRIVKMVVKVIVSTIIGDPTAAVAWLIESIVSSSR
ncbi:Protein kinase C-like [Macleaya cordata]|uniref:Protein kinase C-like n=1 Tax=Macleaya cordata TaxID=56857 RepID=A0A200R6J6_MACCD|nr:Protein kinase C-like [Macleaya cordata]